MKVYKQVIQAIDALIGNTKLAKAVRLDALENIHNHVEPWIDVLSDEVDEENRKALEEG